MDAGVKVIAGILSLHHAPSPIPHALFNVSYYQQLSNVFELDYLSKLQGEILASPYFAVNNLNRDFIGTKGFSLVFHGSGLTEVEQKFPFFKPYLKKALQPNCNAFYLNPLLLKNGSRVDPHIDRSLRSYCKTVEPPALVSVLYVQVPPALEGGELVLRNHKRQVGQIRPQFNTLVYFQGNLTHSVNEVKTPGTRLSLVCEQYSLSETELREIPEFTLESRAIKSEKKTAKRGGRTASRY
ncbi:2OG-Fe(II) oxygenase [Microcoleus sp. FACHB-68]|uniref:2OG-Fe(II) oxygenase n=1 Tax=Microcoleus sp. FACHB-68 TaxID=2692826 RepID=UPI0018EFB137|nr:2OG-Fe(II) oxygenase [Microcoleus sp. FACHB-68]